MSIEIRTSKAPQFPLPFAQALRAGDFVYVSGQVGVDPVTRQLVGNTIAEQAEQCILNIKAILEEAGLSLEHIVKVNVHVSRMDLFAGFNEVYRNYFKEPYPCRTTVTSGLGDYLVEIDAIAYAVSRRGEQA